MDEAGTKQGKKRRMVGWLGGAFALGLIVASVAGLLGRMWWGLDLLSHWRLQYAVLLIPVVIWLAWKRRGLLLVLSAGALALNVTLLAPLYVGGPDAAGASAATENAGKPLRLVSFNLKTGNRQQADGMEATLDADADLIFLLESDNNPAYKAMDWLEQKLAAPGAGAKSPYRIAYSNPKEGHFGIVCVTRIPNLGCRAVGIGPGGVPAVEAVFDWHGWEIAVLGVHPLPPRSGVYTDLRNEHFDGIARWVREQETKHRPSVVIGDFNSSTFSTGFAKLMDSAPLVNSMKGYGHQGTWPADVFDFGPALIAIDHCLHTAAFHTVGRETGDPHGSDHRMLTVDLSLAGK